MSLLLVNYHYVRDPAAYRHPGIHPLAPEAFAAQVDRLLDRLHPATPAEVEAFAAGRPLPRPAFFLTFDDGLIEHGGIVPEILEARGLRGAFFVCSRPLEEGRAVGVHRTHWLRATAEPARFREELLARLPAEWRRLEDDAETRRASAEVNRYDPPEIARLKYLMNFRLPYDVLDAATADMLAERGVAEADFCREMYLDAAAVARLAAAGHVVGSHGHTHRPLSRLSPEERRADLARNLACLGRLSGRPVEWLSYPWGNDWSIPDDAAELCRDLGFRLAITLKRAWNRGGEAACLLNRVNTNEVDALIEPARAAG